jgi:hypothetical protein
MNWQKLSSKQKAVDFIPDIPSWIPALPSSVQRFAPVLAEINKFYSKKRFQELNILELGPGINIQFAQFLRASFPSLQLCCVGIPKYSLSRPYHINKDINRYLLSLPDQSLDLVYSRFVLEVYSFHPVALIFSRAFLRLLRYGAKPHLMEQMPGSYEYWSHTYQILGKKLKTDGRIISMIVDRNKVIDVAEKKIAHLFKLETCIAAGPRVGVFTLRRRGHT